MTGNQSLLTKKKNNCLVLGFALLFLLSTAFLAAFAHDALASQMPVAEPDLTVTAFNTPDSVIAGEPFKASMSVYNQGGARAGRNDWSENQWYDAIYLSGDELWDANDKEIAGAWNFLYLDPGQGYSVEMDATVPGDRPPGTYYLLAVTDAGKTINEFNEANNVMVKKVTVSSQATVSGSCQAAAPALGLAGINSVYWDSYADYVARELTVGFIFANSGAGRAYQATITSIISNNGVTLSTPAPISLGDIAPGGTAPIAIKYHVPSGASRFLSIIAGKSADACGAVYSFSK